MVNFNSEALKNLKEHLNQINNLKERAKAIEKAANQYSDLLADYEIAVFSDLKIDNESVSISLANKLEASQKALADKVAILFELDEEK